MPTITSNQETRTEALKLAVIIAQKWTNLADEKIVAIAGEFDKFICKGLPSGNSEEENLQPAQKPVAETPKEESKGKAARKASVK